MENIEEKEMLAHRKQFVVFAGAFQAILLLLFSMCTKYGDASLAATNKVVITDTINQSIIRGNYAEIFKARDSAIITRKAMAINIIENDSLYNHAC